MTEADRPALEPKNSSSAARSPRAHPMEVHQGQDLGHLRDFLATAAGSQSGTAASPGHLVDPTVVDPWARTSMDPHRSPATGPRHGRCAPPVVTLNVPLVRQCGHISIDLGLQGGGQHAPRPSATSSSSVLDSSASGRLNMYSQHWRPFLAGVPPPAFLRCDQRGRYVAPRSGGASTSSGYNSGHPPDRTRDSFDGTIGFGDGDFRLVVTLDDAIHPAYWAGKAPEGPLRRDPFARFAHVAQFRH